MKERKTDKQKRHSLDAEQQRRRLTARDQIAQALRLCHDIADRNSLMNLCPWLNIQGALELGLLVEQKLPTGQIAYIAGPKLDETQHDVMSAINISVMVAQAARE